ncbi:MAG: hypothetical protein K6G18_03320 [Treponema sp.]|nr:hypothetical protein [Treponema sp.]
MQTLEKVAMNFKNGTIDSRTAAYEIVQLVRDNKVYFKMDLWNIDEFDDFMFKVIPKIKRLVEKYDFERNVCFSTFFYKSFRALARLYVKQKFDDRATEESLECLGDVLIEEQGYRYAQNEGELCVECACDEESLRLQVERPVDEDSSYLMQTISRKYFHSIRNDKLEYFRRTACLVLFLKSCAVIDDSTIRNTSIVTGIGEEKLVEMAEKLRARVEKKLERRKAAGRVRDDAFFLMRKYRIHASNLDEGGHMQGRMNLCSAVQGRRWRRNIRRLERGYNISPSNRDIGAVLNVSERKVANIIKMAHRKLDEIRIREA